MVTLEQIATYRDNALRLLRARREEYNRAAHLFQSEHRHRWEAIERAVKEYNTAMRLPHERVRAAGMSYDRAAMVAGELYAGDVRLALVAHLGIGTPATEAWETWEADTADDVGPFCELAEPVEPFIPSEVPDLRVERFARLVIDGDPRSPFTPVAMVASCIAMALALALGGCTFDTASLTSGGDAVQLDAHDAAPADRASDAPTEGATDTGNDAGEAQDAPMVPDTDLPTTDTGMPDTGLPMSRQRSCPDRSERGCGLVVIEGGTYEQGDTVAPGASPPHATTVSGFALDAYEVTVARFRRYWSAGHPAPASSIAYPGGHVLAWTGSVAEPTPGDPYDAGNGCNWSTEAGARELHPVNCVDRYTAQAFCAWDGGRLPTEAEWEWAARGRAVDGLATGRPYPWGDAAPSCARLHWHYPSCTGEDGAITRRVGSAPAAGGVFDLAGNVWEWVADAWSTYGSGCATGVDPLCTSGSSGTWRGGSLAQVQPESVRATARMSAPPSFTTRAGSHGFRCAR